MSLKTQNLSVRLSKSEYEQIKERAANKGLTVSRYMVQSALSDTGISLKTKQKIYAELLCIRDSATNRISSQKIIEGCDNLWRFLK